jgi:hypothetical protein
MSPQTSRYRVSLIELRPDGTTKERFSGDGDAYLLAVVATVGDQLRVCTDHDGPAEQRHTALEALITHLRATMGRGGHANALAHARRLVRQLRASELVAIRVPTRQEEAVRDLCRVRAKAVEDLTRAKSCLAHFLIRHGRIYRDGTTWTLKHRSWLAAQSFDHPALTATFGRYTQTVVTQSPTGPGGSYFEAKVPGYRTYNLEKAKTLVKELGGLSVTLSTAGNSPTLETEVEGIQSQWEQAGIHVTLVFQTLAADIEQYKADVWEAHVAGAGGPDPDIGIQGLSVHLSSKGAFSGVRDPALDRLIAKSEELANGPVRQKVFHQIFERINRMAYEPYLYAGNAAVIASHSLTGVRVTDATGETQLYWEHVGLK